ncbi:MAG: dihydrodipicolinate synthase family protein [Alphaproteobacteria bacterium]|nr:dihydrodipicolinate synthase family protein [Alphaproteobacteria bacterium]
MVSCSDLSGIMAMMPAFTNDDGNSIDCTNSISVERLEDGVNKMIADGAGVISTCGSFGEFHTLLDEEWRDINRATVEIAAKRVPIFVGCTALNSREAVKRMAFAEEIGAYGVLVGVPFYFPSSVENAVNFYKQISERFPKLGIMIYHNPALHNVTLPVPCFQELVKCPNLIAMKDSHRDTMQFMKLQEIIKGHISVFCNQFQFHPYYELGAAGFWSIDAWHGPEPLLALHEAVVSGNETLAREIMFAISPVTVDRTPNLSWRETASKIGIRYAGYCDPGPLRPPFNEVPEAVDKAQKARAEKWKELRKKYRPQGVRTAAE